MLIIFIQHALHALFLFFKFIYFVMAMASEADQLYPIGSGPSSGCVHIPIIIALDYIKMLIIFIQHAPCTIFHYEQFIYYVMAQAMDVDQLYVIGVRLSCPHRPKIITLESIEMIIILIQHASALQTLFLFSKFIYSEWQRPWMQSHYMQ